MNGTLSWHYCGDPAVHCQAWIMTSEILLFFITELCGLGSSGSLLSLSHIAFERANVRDSKTWDSDSVLSALKSPLLDTLFLSI